MKTFAQIAKTKKKPLKAKPPVYNFKKPPTPLPPKHDPYENICRIMPFYVAQNYEYFALLTPPLQEIQDWDGYCKRIIKKISCMKSDFLL